MIEGVMALGTDKQARGAICVESPPNGFGRKLRLADARRAYDEVRRKGRPKLQQGLLLGLVEIAERVIFLLGLRERFAAGTPHTPRIVEHGGEINPGVECLDIP